MLKDLDPMGSRPARRYASGDGEGGGAVRDFAQASALTVDYGRLMADKPMIATHAIVVA